MADIFHLENRHDVIFSEGVRFGQNFADWCRMSRMTCRLRWCGRNRNQK